MDSYGYGLGEEVVNRDTFLPYFPDMPTAAPIADTTACWAASGALRMFVNAQAAGAGETYSALSSDGVVFGLDLDAGSVPVLPMGMGAGQVESFRDAADTLWVYYSGSVDGVSGIYSRQSVDDGETFSDPVFTGISDGDVGITADGSGGANGVVTGLSVARGMNADGVMVFRGYFGVEPQAGRTDAPPRAIYTATSMDLTNWALEYTVIGAAATFAPRPPTLGTASPITGESGQPFALQQGDGCVTLFYYRPPPATTIGGTTQIYYSTSVDLAAWPQGVTFLLERELRDTDLRQMANGPAGPTIVTMPDGSLVLYVDSGHGPPHYSPDAETHFIAAFVLNQT